MDTNSTVDCSLYLFNECNDTDGCHYVEIFDDEGNPISGSCIPDEVIDENDANGSVDSDGDLLTDRMELTQYGTDPYNNDTDGDGLEDGWEIMNGLDPLDSGDETDSDGDGVGDNSDMFPNDANESADSDGDGVGDNSDMFPNDANDSVDSDGDGVGDNSDAYPNDACATTDTDGDGLPDNILDGPNDPIPDCQTSLVEDEDDDNDTIPDEWEEQYGSDPLNGLDVFEDWDGDGLSTLEEYWAGTDPLLADTDGDGMIDSVDDFPNDSNESLDTDGDGIGNNEDSDDDGDGVFDNQDLFPFDSSEWFDSDGDGIGNNADSSPWLASNGNGSFDMNYSMVGYTRGHELFWLSFYNDCPCYAYYYTATPDSIWTDGNKSKVFSISDMPNVNATLSMLGMSLENLSVQSRPIHLGDDIRYEDWDYDSNTGIEWRILTGNLSVLYLDDDPIFAINVSLNMYLDYYPLLSGDPVTMWGNSDSGALIDMSTGLFTGLLYQAFLNDFGNGTINYSFTSQDVIISDEELYASNSIPPANATTLLSDLIASGVDVYVGTYNTIVSTVHVNQSQVGGNSINITAPTKSYTNYFEGINTENRRTEND